LGEQARRLSIDRIFSGGSVALTDALRMTSLSDPGMVRDLNEDSIELRPESGIAVLADGMGGYNAGEVASGMATSLVANGLEQGWTEAALKDLDRAATIALSQTLLQAQVMRANAEIFAAAQGENSFEGMGTTLVACLFHDDFITVGHAGDSRLYRLRDDVLEQITRDHSLLQEQIDSGMIKKEDAHLSNNRNYITRAIGVAPEEQAEIHTYDVREGDIYLICTDGLFGMVNDEEIMMTVSTLRANLDLAAEQLIQSANDAGGSDNVSLILVRVMKSYARSAVH
jgi:serine/threonine protein phosphatase PrpC